MSATECQSNENNRANGYGDAANQYGRGATYKSNMTYDESSQIVWKFQIKPMLLIGAKEKTRRKCAFYLKEYNTFQSNQSR